MDDAPTHIYVGPRASVIAELGNYDFCSGKYLIGPHGSGRYVADGCANKKEVSEQVKWWRKQVPGIRVVYL